MVILASDYDGTLFFGEGIDQKDLDMIHELRNLGGKFGIVSGRSVSAIIEETKEHHIPYDFIIGVNGGFVLDENLKEIYTSYINKDTAQKIIAFYHEDKPLSYTLHDGYRLAVNVFEKDFALNIKAEFTDEKTLLQDKVSGFFSHFSDTESAEAYGKRIEQLFPDVKAQANKNFLDITALNINKANGIQKLLDHSQWDMPLWVIGDARNDQDMIQAYSSFAMHSGDEYLKEHADYVVKSVAEAIEYLLENNGI